MTVTTQKPLPDSEFEQLGGGDIAYIRPVLSDDVPTMFPDAPQIAPGLKLWVLLNADGTPIMLTDSRAAAEAGARQNELQAFNVH